jgi:hypothetical protein
VPDRQAPPARPSGARQARLLTCCTRIAPCPPCRRPSRQCAPPTSVRTSGEFLLQLLLTARASVASAAGVPACSVEPRPSPARRTRRARLCASIALDVALESLLPQCRDVMERSLVGKEAAHGRCDSSPETAAQGGRKVTSVEPRAILTLLPQGPAPWPIPGTYLVVPLRVRCCIGVAKRESDVPRTGPVARAGFVQVHIP